MCWAKLSLATKPNGISSFLPLGSLVDAAFMAAHDRVSMNLAPACIDAGVNVIDYSGDFRFDPPDLRARRWCAAGRRHGAAEGYRSAEESSPGGGWAPDLEEVTQDPVDLRGIGDDGEDLRELLPFARNRRRPMPRASPRGRRCVCADG